MAICTKRLRGSSSRKRTIIVLIVCIWLLAIPLALPNALFKKLEEYQLPPSHVADSVTTSGAGHQSRNASASAASNESDALAEADAGAGGGGGGRSGQHVAGDIIYICLDDWKFLPYYILFVFVPFDYVLPVRY